MNITFPRVSIECVNGDSLVYTSCNTGLIGIRRYLKANDHEGSSVCLSNMWPFFCLYNEEVYSFLDRMLGAYES